jgi:hypothetical protein
MIMKENSLAMEAKSAFEKYVVNVFQQFFGEGAFTFSLPLFKPLAMLLDLTGNQHGEIEHFDSYLTWALETNNLRLGDTLNNGFSFLRAVDPITAKICLLVSKRVDDPCVRSTLLKEALTVCTEAVKFSKKKKSCSSIRYAVSVLEGIQLELLDCQAA